MATKRYSICCKINNEIRFGPGVISFLTKEKAFDELRKLVNSILRGWEESHENISLHFKDDSCSLEIGNRKLFYSIAEYIGN